MILEHTIKKLITNGDYDCEDCGHKAKDIQTLVNIVEAAKEHRCYENVMSGKDRLNTALAEVYKTDVK